MLIGLLHQLLRRISYGFFNTDIGSRWHRGCGMLRGSSAIGGYFIRGFSGCSEHEHIEVSQLILPQITNVIYFGSWFSGVSDLASLTFADVSAAGNILYCTSAASGLYMELPALVSQSTANSYGYQGVRVITTLGAELPAAEIYGAAIVLSGNVGCNSNITTQGQPAYNYGSVAFTEHERLLMVQQYTTPLQKEVGNLLTLGWLVQLFSAQSVDV